MKDSRYEHILDYLKCNYCNSILEIGVCRGSTSRKMLKCSKNKQIEYHGIDLFEDATVAIRKKEVSLVAAPMKVVLSKLRKVSPNVFLHKGFSSELFPSLQRLRFDLIWFDGGHSYETVESDFENYSTLLSEDGIIFFDDYTKDPFLPDVKRYIDTKVIPNPLYEVAIHNRHKVDMYRGYEYMMVSIKVNKDE